jgi:hypothetical protein
MLQMMGQMMLRTELQKMGKTTSRTTGQSRQKTKLPTEQTTLPTKFQMT